MKTSTRLEEYVAVLQTRKKWALRAAIGWGVLCVLLFAFSYSVTSEYMGRPMYHGDLDGFLLPLFFLLAFAAQAIEYRRLKGVLELLDVLQHLASEKSPEDKL